MGTTLVTGGLGKSGDRKRRDQKPRVLQSCTLCRQRKLRCNRKLPCDNCAKRNEESTCRYATASPIRSENRGPTLPSRVRYLEDRIKHLEYCIGQTSSTTRLRIDTPDEDMRMQGTHKSSPGDGLLLSEPSGTRYINFAHWQTIMNATRALKEGSPGSQTSSGANTEEPIRTPRGPFLLVGLSGEMSINDLLAALPPRDIVESLVSTYLNSNEPSLNFIHRPTFKNECNDLWKDPTKVSPAWLACLYGIMSCAVWIDHTTNQTTSKANEVPETFDFYRKSCALCLTSSNYTTPGRYKVEALGLYIGLEYLSSNNLKTGVLVLLGICIRLAIMMGYHQDSGSYSHISVFEAEMRRRTWLFLQITDSIVSCQTGVPRVISRRLGNTALPRDLLDTSFGSTTVELPPPQSDTERPTSITYMLAVWRLTAIANEMMDTLSVKTLSYDETIQLNHDLEVARDHIPPLLRMQATDLSCPIRDNDIIIERHRLEITFQRARCILHRQYLLANRTESKYDHFRRTCVNAAQRIIELQIKMFQEILPRARQHRKAWIGASISITDGLTAAMIICFEIMNLSQAEHKLHANRISGLIELLRDLYNTWKIAPEPSFETSQSADTLAAMFKLFQPGDSNITLRPSGPIQSTEHDTQAPPRPCSEPAKEETETQDPLTVGCLQDLLNTDWEFEMFDWCLWDREMQELNGIISDNMTS